MDKKKVMIIDDEESFIKIVKMNLEDTAQYEVLALSSANDVITHMHSFRPDIILLDLLMPHMGGVAACEIINKDPVGKGTPIIILSALDSDRGKLIKSEKGIVDYLVKPIEKDALIAKIEKALSFKKKPL